MGVGDVKIDLGARSPERSGRSDILPPEEAILEGTKAYSSVVSLLPDHEWAERSETGTHIQDTLDLHSSADPQHFLTTLHGLEQAQVIYGYVLKDAEKTDEKVAFLWRNAGSLDVTTVQLEVGHIPLVTLVAYQPDGSTEKSREERPFTKDEAARVVAIEKAMRDVLIDEYNEAKTHE